MMILTFYKNFHPFRFIISEICRKYNCYRKVVTLLTMFLSSFSKDSYDQMEMKFGKPNEVFVIHGTKHNKILHFLHRCYG